MTKPLAVRSVLVLLVLLTGASFAQAQEPPDVTIDLINPAPDGLLELDVGESYTFEIEVASEYPFILTMVLPDQYYPGRGIFVRGGDRAGRGTEATLFVTVTGKASTAGLEPVHDWPVEGSSWPEEGEVAPVSLVVGVRFQGGVVSSEHFDFAVSVE